MIKKAYVHTFHSQVINTLRNLDFFPDSIFSFDSHFDGFLGNKEQIDAMPKEIRDVAVRACAHTMIKRTYTELPFLREEPNDLFDTEFVIIMPKVCFETEIKLKTIELNKMLSDAKFRSYNEAKKFINNFHKSQYGMVFFVSPPNHPMKLIKKRANLENVLVDIDVDYFGEMQLECYTPMRKARTNELDKIVQVLKFIRKLEPEVITISEAKLSAIMTQESHFNKFLNNLRKLDYDIEFVETCEDDEDELRKLAIYKKYETVVNIVFDKSF